jgi:HK97 family phage major capsid protein
MQSTIRLEAMELAKLLEPTWGSVSARIIASGGPTCLQSNATKDRLKQVEADISTARDERAAKAKERDAAREAFAGKESADHTSPEFIAARKAVAELGQVDEKLSGLSEVQVFLLKELGQDPETKHTEKAAGSDEDLADGEWSSKALFDQDMRDRLAQAATSKSHMGDIRLGSVASRDTLKADITGTANLRRGAFAGIVPQLRRRIRLLDLISVGTTDGNLVPYTQMGGTYAAAETTESVAKPESGMTLTDASALVQTIAAWQKIPKQVLSDIAAVESMIDGRLRYEVLRRLEGQILAGNGSAPNLQGILSTAGIGAFTGVTGTPFGEQILTGITQVMLAEAEATVVVVNPTNWQTIITTKASGSGEYLNEIEPITGSGLGAVGGAGTVIPTLWGLPVVASTVIAAGTALVGDFTMGAQLFIREGVNVLMSDSDQDDFIKNRLTILAEMRAALAVWQPAAFSKITLTT